MNEHDYDERIARLRLDIARIQLVQSICTALGSMLTVILLVAVLLVVVKQYG